MTKNRLIKETSDETVDIRNEADDGQVTKSLGRKKIV